MTTDTMVTFICLERHSEDSYYDDPIQGEVHTLEGKTKVVEHQVSVFDAKEWVEKYNDKNADNPPYDSYKIKLAYWSETKELIDLRQFGGY